MKKIVSRLSNLNALAIASVGAAFTNVAGAAAAGVGEIQNGVNATGVDANADIGTIVSAVTNILVFIIGLAAVIMIIIGAIKYVTANGDQSNITSAKNTILYSIVGLILAIAAGAIVNFVIAQFPA